ncbi:hypothetical protein Ahy_B03g064066 [Arachis hypogaea]|uniref:PAS domain-containing protein n=1 Tax=Arachis hypogaea TaxID=3818 RepID=A0A444ZYK2_ARAHY|nr:hypothetical protein Ahy_B03g064066 [Arachis hypogaea]
MLVILVLLFLGMQCVAWRWCESVRGISCSGSGLTLLRKLSAFFEVVKSKSSPWEASEINAIHSLQLIIRDSFHNSENSGIKAMNYIYRSDAGIDELSSVAFEMVRLIETATVPIFGVDTGGLINGWNVKITELTGLLANEAIGKSLVNEVAHADSRNNLENIQSKSLQGQDTTCEKVVLEKFVKLEADKNSRSFPWDFLIEAYITANKRIDTSGNMIGCFCFLQIVSRDPNQPWDGQNLPQRRKRISESKEFAYILQEMMNPLNA